MRRLLAWLGGLLGGVALYRAATRRSAVGALPAPEPLAPPDPHDTHAGTGVDPRAAELRRKLEESRLLVEERDEFEGGETPVDRAEPAEDPEARRRHVHDEARAGLERMRSTGPE